MTLKIFWEEQCRYNVPNCKYIVETKLKKFHCLNGKLKYTKKGRATLLIINYLRSEDCL